MRDKDWYAKKSKRLRELREEMHRVQHRRFVRFARNAEGFADCPFSLPSRLGE
jgi:hypothetical protein